MTSSPLEDQRTVWIVAVVAFVLFLIGNLPWQLDDYDQAKQAFSSFEMTKEGHWFYQQTPHGNVATKPPLVGWISAGLYALTRSWDVAWRLPSFLAAIAIAILLFRAARSMDGLRSTRLAPERGEDEGEGSSSRGTIAALIALGAFGLNLLSPRLATLVRTDMPLALVIFLIGVLIWQKIRDETHWSLKDQVYLFALLTVAMLIKGPIVYAFLLPGIALFQWRLRKAARRAVVAGVDDPGQSRGPRPEPVLRGVEWGAPLDESIRLVDKTGCSQGAVSPCKGSRGERLAAAKRRQGAWPGWWPWVASLAVFLLWVTGGILFQPGFFDEVVMREFVARFGETIHRAQPLYFYLPHLLHKFAPWSVLMIGIALADLHSRKWRLRPALREMSPETFWLICWSLGGLIVMSLIPSKRVDRIFPIVPPLCLLLAAQIGRNAAPCSHGSVSRFLTSVDSDLTGHRPVATTTEEARACIYRWGAAALVFAILFTDGYTIFKVISGYRHHRAALVVFGKNVRREAEAHHWRYEVVSAKDEGLLLYLQKTHFIEPQRAVTEWNSGNVDALVASTRKAPDLMRELRDAALSQLKSSERQGEQGSGYVLITR
jgi:4-amino-4-deoxy-L-arabinose transferase-like glycosyltransferase